MGACPQPCCLCCIQESLFEAFSRLVSCISWCLVLCSIWMPKSPCAWQCRWGKSLFPGMLAAMAQDAASKHTRCPTGKAGLKSRHVYLQGDGWQR